MSPEDQELLDEWLGAVSQPVVNHIEYILKEYRDGREDNLDKAYEAATDHGSFSIDTAKKIISLIQDEQKRSNARKKLLMEEALKNGDYVNWSRPFHSYDDWPEYLWTDQDREFIERRKQRA